MPSTACRTQIVTASGSQTSRPAIRYFFTRCSSARSRSDAPPARHVPPLAGPSEPVRPRAQRRAQAAGAAAGSLLAASRLGRVLAVRRCERRPRRPCLRTPARRRPRSTSPAFLSPRKSVTYQPEPLSWKPAAVTCLTNVDRAARRADVQRRIGNLPQHVLRVAAGRAAIGVDRHRRTSDRKQPDSINLAPWRRRIRPAACSVPGA